MMRQYFLLCLLATLLISGCSAAAPAPAPAPAETPTPPLIAAEDSTPAEPVAPVQSAEADTLPPAVTITADDTEIPIDGQTTVHVMANDPSGISSLSVYLGDQVLATAEEGAQLTFDLTPGDIDGVEPGKTYTLEARVTDGAGNEGRATLDMRFDAAASLTPGATTQAPAETPAKAGVTPKPVTTARATPAPALTQPAGAASDTPEPGQPETAPGETSYRVTEITLNTYPFAPFVKRVSDPNVGSYPVSVLDRAGYDASQPQPATKKYRLLVLENRYLRLGILPELGGRIYECTFKPTGNNEFYSNSVVKPTSWGPPSPPSPQGANWWLALGGLEWGFPVEEHGYEWGSVWGYDHVRQDDGGVMLTMFTKTGPQNPYAVADIILPPDTAYFVIQPHVINPWGGPFKFKWWADAMLAPGAANKPGSDLRFIFPVTEMTVQTSGDASLPSAGQPMSWPIYGGRDLSRIGNLSQPLGFLERPSARGNFMGVYDPAADEGMMRVFPADVAQGAAGYAPGGNTGKNSQAWTDDGSGYVELRGGLTRAPDDWYELPAGGEVTWSETWYPIAGIGGVTYAEEDGALNMVPYSGGLRIAFFPTSVIQGQFTVSLPGMDPLVSQVEAGPERPITVEVPYAGNMPERGEVKVTFVNAQGYTLLSYEGQAALR